jgi:hypothetical protein
VDAPFHEVAIVWKIAFSEETSACLELRRKIGRELLGIAQQIEDADLRLTVFAEILNFGMFWFDADLTLRARGWGTIAELAARAEAGDGEALAHIVAAMGLGIHYFTRAGEDFARLGAQRDARPFKTLSKALEEPRRGQVAERIMMKANLAWRLPLFRHLHLTATQIQEHLRRVGEPDPGGTPGAVLQRLKRMGLKLSEGKERPGT